MLAFKTIISICKRYSCLTFLGVAFLSPQVFAGETLPSVVSLDYCADQYVLVMADRTQIKAVSKQATTVYSYYQSRAVGIPQIYSSIAEVIDVKPDIAVQSYNRAAHMPNITKRVGIDLVRTQYGTAPETALKNIQHIGNILNQSIVANRFIADYRERLKRLRALPTINMRVAYLTPGGFTSGQGTFVNDLIKLAGYISYADTKGYQGWLELPVEDLIMDPPDMFITSFFKANIQSHSHWSLARHDRLISMLDHIPTINLPSGYMACDGLFSLHAAERIRTETNENRVLNRPTVTKGHARK